MGMLSRLRQRIESVGRRNLLSFALIVLLLLAFYLFIIIVWFSGIGA